MEKKRVNAIGIDYQQSVTTVILREGRREAARFQNVGDGLRQRIPTLSAPGGIWGTRALYASTPDARAQSRPTAVAPWLSDNDAADFWQGLSARLFGYLGQVTPMLRRGYHVIIALHGMHDDTTMRRVEALARASGLVDATCIPATTALVCRWLAERSARDAAPEHAVAVVVGEATTTVAAFSLRESRPHHRDIAQLMAPIALEVGQEAWADELIGQCASHTVEGITQDQLPLLRDAALEFGTRLGSADPEQALQWEGPPQVQLFTPVVLSRNDCASWESVRRLAELLPPAIEQAFRIVPRGKDRRPPLVLIGGSGAGWPFARDIARGIAAVWRSVSPQEDVGRGATWWPEVRQGFAEATRIVGPLFPSPVSIAPEEVEEPEWLVGDIAASNRLPPWASEADTPDPGGPPLEGPAPWDEEYEAPGGDDFPGAVPPWEKTGRHTTPEADEDDFTWKRR